jgi:acylphosphatase
MDENRLAGLRVTVRGRVQGVFFRESTRIRANALGITGCVSNLSDGETVEVSAEGELPRLREIVDYLRVGPPRARVEEITTEWSEYRGQYSTFNVK